MAQNFWENDLPADDAKSSSAGEWWAGDMPAATDTPAAAEPSASRAVVPEMTLGSVARDVVAGASKIVPTAIKSGADALRLVTGDRVGVDVSNRMKQRIKDIDDVGMSDRARAQSENFQKDMADPNVSVKDALLNNKGALSDQILPTVGSMLLPAGAAGAGAKIATAGKAVTAAERGALAAKGAAAGAMAGNVASNAGSTYSELRDEGVDQAGAYKGAAISGAASVLAGKLTGGGADAAVGRAIAGQGAAKAGVAGVAGAMAKEGGQEVVEEFGNQLGQAEGSGKILDVANVPKQLAVAGSLGAVMGGGGHGIELAAKPREVSFTDPNGPVAAAGITPVVVPVPTAAPAAVPSSMQAAPVQVPTAPSPSAALTQEQQLANDVAGRFGIDPNAAYKTTQAAVEPVDAPVTTPAPAVQAPDPVVEAAPVAKAPDAEVAQPAAQVEAAPAAEPVEVHTPRRGPAYKTTGDADIAMRSISRHKTDLDWKVEPTEGGYRVAAYARPKNDIDTAAEAAATSPMNDLPEPTQAQKEAGNYKKAHVKWQGLDLAIENPKGSERKGVDPDGKPWSVELPAHYGYVKRTEGADGDHVDIYMGPNPDSDRVFVVDQVDARTGAFDEHKVMLGADSQAQAEQLYDAGFSDGKGPDRRSAVTEMSAAEFKAWVRDGVKSGPLSEPKPQAALRQQLVAGKKTKMTPKALQESRAAYYTPGNVVNSYGGGHDRVVGYEPLEGGQWRVKVKAVKKDANGQWVETGAPMRTHSTQPELGQLVAGPVERAETVAAPSSAPEAVKLPVAKGAPQVVVKKAVKRLMERRRVMAEVVEGDGSEAHQAASAVAKLFGKSLTVLRKKDGRGTMPNGFVDETRGHIFVSQDSDDGALFVVMHEVGHSLPADLKTELVETLRPLMREEMKTTFAHDFGYDSTKQSLVDEELAMYMTQSVAREVSFWQKVRAKIGDSKFGQIARHIIGKIDEITGDAKKAYGQEFLDKYATDSVAVREAVAEVFAQASKRAEGKTLGRAEPGQSTIDLPVEERRPVPTTWDDDNDIPFSNADDDVRYSFAGKEAETADVSARDRALEMEESGAAKEDIRKETGWFRGADKQWRYEIDDSGVQLKAEAPSPVDVYRATGKTADGLIESDPGHPLAQQALRARELEDGMRGEGVPVSSLVQADELFTAYPRLKDLHVRISDGLGVGEGQLATVSRGGSKPRPASIEVGAGTNGKALKSVLLHEMQHAIQSYEGFAGGKDATVDEGYQDAPGEVEARNVQSRMDLTAEERSATPPSDTADLAFSNAPVSPLSGKPIPDETMARRVQRFGQDAMNRFTVLREWAEKNGVKLSDSANVYSHEERMHGRVATRLEEFREETVKPLIQKAQKAGFTLEQVSEFLHMQHAKERNAQIAKLDPEFLDGSGISDADADAFLKKADPKLKALANEVRAITDRTKTALLDAGIINADMVAKWDGAYKNYVPLKSSEGSSELGDPTKKGKGNSVQAKQQRALGRGLGVDTTIVANIFRDYEKAVMNAEKNTIGQSLLAFVAELQNPAIATIGQPEQRRALKMGYAYEVVDSKTGQAIATFDEEADAYSHLGRSSIKKDLRVRRTVANQEIDKMDVPLADHEVQVYVAGHAIRVQLNDALLSRAYQRLGMERLPVYLQAAQKVNRFLSQAYTGVNPEFTLINPVRDFTAGVINITGEFGAAKAAKVVATYPKALAQLLKHQYRPNTPVPASIAAYKKAGGTTGGAYLSDIERLGGELQDAYNRYEGAVSLAKRGKFADAAKVAGGKLYWALTTLIERMNSATENAYRLAVFETLKETEGVNAAASAAKNSTVNFNRKGELGSHLGAMYLFFNPGVQGTAVLGHALFKGKHKYQAQAMTASLMGSAFALAAMQYGGGEEDDEAWDRIPGNVKDRNIIVRTGADSYITIPIPYGYAYAATMGYAMLDLIKGKDLDEVSMSLASGILENFSPMGNPLGGAQRWGDVSSSGMVEMTPGFGLGEITRAGMRLAANRNGLGSEIVPDAAFDTGKPDNLRMNRTTKGTIYEGLASEINRITGGTATQSGAVDVSPETIKFWNSTITGGVGTFLSDFFNLSNLASRAASGEEGDLSPELKDIPVIRKFHRYESVKDSRAAFWSAAKAARRAQEDFNRAAKFDDQEGLDRVAAQKEAELSVADWMSAQSKMVAAIRDEVTSIMSDDSIPLGMKRIKVRELELEEKKIYDEAAAEFSGVKKKAKDGK